jgi:hypothetical protein
MTGAILLVQSGFLRKTRRDPGWHRHWLTGFVEYDYYGFQNNSPSALVCAPGACGGVIVTNAVGVTTNINVVKVGLNLKFSPGGF